MSTDKNKPAPDDMYDGLTKEQFDKRMQESFDFGAEGAFQVMEDAMDRDLDSYAVASEMFHTAAFALWQHGVSLDDMVAGVKDAIEYAKKMDKENADNDKIIDALHEQGLKPEIEA